ncbi:MAG TPA: ribosome small subunit-dependent GTPase A [Nitriliruptorales bacterium]
MPRIDIDAIEEEYDDQARTPGRRISQAAKDKLDDLPVARVLGTDRGHVDVLLDGDRHQARYGGQMRGRKVVVGDRVRVRPPRHRTDTVRIVDRLERETVLARTGDDTEGDERVIVANADQVAVVLAADYLEAVRFLDRVLVAAHIGGLGALVVINKVDLDLDDDDRAAHEAAARYADIGYPVVLTSATEQRGIDELRTHLEGRWSTFSGHSGVGKSSLFNLLLPDADHDVADLGRYGGRHTTVAARALRVPDLADTWLVDTPGVRSFGLGLVDPHDLPGAFPELAGLRCDLDDCLHDGEPGCLVEQAEIHPDRLASYRRLLEAVRRGTESGE